ncbi:hypothetical protein JN086_23015 [Mycolicibacterium austroafricanum]|jgi:uncharacterized membrane protein HdeD (DUF308 family)|uniref:UsfY protein n=1 Tax=Mycolicibacterium austroafricanum TaxID=39687 RepID=A0ABT8HN55_MYCAO|nr:MULTISPECIES: hypothetical protein [Mycolicibacterium]MDN4522186.1 hypothetical protein [Mycolicibacterium austroafricanum]MDW5613246.1 hypothetical protein [Mycolicibacterium sp. D5.8-2]QRZ05786.1 hypothetical protein JN090_23115 [Mycolicibacterium austroafricanum]QZT55896.1 hypothetical protein JN084_23625 [Mycolicibacterium austroafricanum]QZT67342.1 hypothetical protein JN086_23015 [Mycolicibacterium austroafricanum]
MPDTSRDPVDHARTYRQHAGETMKAGVNAPGLIAVGIGVLSLVIGLFSFANGSRSAGVAAVVVALLLVGGGLAWLARAHHKVQKKQQDWHREHPEAPYEPPTS